MSRIGLTATVLATSTKFLMLLFLLTASNSISGIEHSEKNTIAYADFLYRRGEFYRSITEYQRYLYFYSDGKASEHAQLQIGKSYMSGKSYLEAIDYWNELLADDNSASSRNTKYLSRLLLAVTHFDINASHPFGARFDHITQGFDIIDKMNDSLPAVKVYKDFASSYEIESETLPFKSGFAAGAMSAILPGAGSAYAENYIEATYVFFFNSLFLYAAIDSNRNEQKVYTPVFSFFFLAFYGGGIYSAVNGVEKYNDRLKNELFIDLRNKYNIHF